MAIAAVITRGYGSFGSIAEVVTRGYGATSSSSVIELLEEIIALIKKQGFRRERVTKEDLLKQNNQLLIEIRDIKRKLNTQPGSLPGGY